jgi:hypothetical protein
MDDEHTFRFDEEKAYEDQLASVLEARPDRPLSIPDAPHGHGVYVLFCRNVPVFVGKAKDLRSRLNERSRKTAIRNIQDVTCRFVTIERMWEVLRAKAAVERHYNLK